MFTPYNIRVLAIVCVTVFFSALNASAITIILPLMSSEYAINPGQASWIISIYFLVYGVAIPFYGRLSTRFGVRRLFLIGISFYTLGSLASMLAPNFASMMLGRFIQALGGAAFPALGLAIISQAFTVEHRGKAIGMVVATLSVASAIGPVVSGSVAELLNWRMVFAIGILVGVILPLAWNTLSKDKQTQAEAIDWLGGASLAATVVGTLYIISTITQAEWSTVNVIIAAMAVVIGIATLITRQRHAEHPFIPRVLLANTDYMGLITLSFSLAVINFGALLSLPLLLTTEFSINVLQIGVILLPGAIISGLGGVLAGYLMDKTGAKVPTRLGLVLVSATILALTFLPQHSVLSITIMAGTLGLGTSLINTPLSTLLSIIFKPQLQASAMSFNTMMFFLGGATGGSLILSVISLGGTSHAFVDWQNLGAYRNSYLLLVMLLVLVAILVSRLPSGRQEESNSQPTATNLAETNNLQNEKRNNPMSDKTIVVFGATGQQGGGVIEALRNNSDFKIRGVSRDTNSDQAQALQNQGIEMVTANLNDAASITAALQDAYGVFLVTNFWDPSTGASEYEQVKTAVLAAQQTGIEHFVWSTLPNVEQISAGKFSVPHFTNKATANQLVADAGFKYHSFVEAPFFFQNFLGSMAPQPTEQEGVLGWAVPMDPNARCLHAGDINELGLLVAGIFAQPDKTGHGATYSMSPGTYSWQDLADALNDLGHQVVVNQVPGEMYDHFYPGADEVRAMMEYFQAHSYFGPQAAEKIADANDIVEQRFTRFTDWAKAKMPA